ncbi:hypothetical protein SAMN04487982_115105 [Streptomyces sp. ok210]|nr:hypothetical protein SAMN04487982_115105 [Streptomyces sp. ok210]
MTARVDTSVGAGQAEHEVRSAAAYRVEPRAGGLVPVQSAVTICSWPGCGASARSPRTRQLGLVRAPLGHRTRRPVGRARRERRRCSRVCLARAEGDGPPASPWSCGSLERCTDQIVRARPVLCGAVPDTEGRQAHRAGPLRVLVVWPFGVLSARDHQEVGAGRHPDGQRASVRSRLERQPWVAPVYGPARFTGTSTRMQRGLTPTWRSSWWLPGSIGDAVRRTDADVRRAVNRGSRCRPGPDFATPGYRGPRRAALTDATRIRVVARRLSAFRHAVRVGVGHTVTGWRCRRMYRRAKSGIKLTGNV